MIVPSTFNGYPKITPVFFIQGTKFSNKRTAVQRAAEFEFRNYTQVFIASPTLLHHELWVFVISNPIMKIIFALNLPYNRWMEHFVRTLAWSLLICTCNNFSFATSSLSYITIHLSFSQLSKGAARSSTIAGYKLWKPRSGRTRRLKDVFVGEGGCGRGYI